MGGIFGLIAGKQSGLTEKRFMRAFLTLTKLSERRGRETAGLALAHSDRISIYKKAMMASVMLRSRDFSNFIRPYFSSSALDKPSQLTEPFATLGNAGLAISGSQAIARNNQPITIGHITGVHDGIITNYKGLLARYPELRNISGSYSDTKVLLGLINKYYEQAKGDIATALTKCYREIEGSASIALFCDDLPLLILATNTGALYYAFDKKKDFFVFGSEHYIVRRFLKKSTLLKSSSILNVCHLKLRSAALVKFKDVIPEIFPLGGTTVKYEQIQHIKNKELCKIVDATLPKKTLRLCTKCVLPETFPFISFDSDGVCNYCRRYKKQEFLGYEALEPILEKYRSKDGSPDCIVGYSGGRDSSYALHTLKTKLGMHPIAYTYYWALGTEKAGFNQARVIGKLGIEHITRAADIQAKRRHIRKNICAWLKKPELGMVPLFMAGDKMFYWYGRQLRKETGMKLTVLAAGYQLEQMEFKVGFCGIDQHRISNIRLLRLYHYDTLAKIQLALWYALQYLKNPAYLNESLLDSTFQFYVSFISKDDCIYLYNYVPWDEKLIERTLKEEYGWQADEEYGKNQWRMGDGQTAFINYIYYTIAGFSEFDNFRSNQIREGLITREEAIEFVKEDNKPRLEMLRDFSKQIGFNLEDVLLKINKIPKMH